MIKATLSLEYPKAEFLEYCTEHRVKPDVDLLRSWLIEKAINDNAADNLDLIRSDHDQGWFAALS